MDTIKIKIFIWLDAQVVECLELRVHFIIFYLFIFSLLFICAYNVWVISPPLPPTPPLNPPPPPPPFPPLSSF
jgi:hypothetical protein